MIVYAERKKKRYSARKEISTPFRRGPRGERPANVPRERAF